MLIGVAQREVEKLKQKVTERLALAFLDFKKLFQVDYDASGATIGVRLSQEGQPIAFFSEKLMKLNISIHSMTMNFMLLFKH